MVEVMGCPWETTDARDVVDKNLRWNHTLKNIASPNLIIMVYQCRGLADHRIYPAGEFRSDFAASLDAAYRGKLFEQSVVRKPARSSASSSGRSVTPGRRSVSISRCIKSRVNALLMRSASNASRRSWLCSWRS